MINLSLQRCQIMNIDKGFLEETETIDYNEPIIQEKVNELKQISRSQQDYIKNAYRFVRDNIPHSWDIRSEIVSRRASEVLINGTGICWTKSCILAALLRANKIPSGISYQLLTRAYDASEGYMIHALNTLHIKDLNKWIRLDARGNEENINAYFSLDEEHLAYSIQSELGEIDYRDNHDDLDERLVNILGECENILEIRTDFEF